MKNVRLMVMVVGVLAGAASAGWAQSRPLVTQDPETVPTGHVLFEAGFDYDRSAIYPASGLTGNLSRVLPFSFSFGVSSMAEIQVGGGVRNLLSITKRDPSAPLAPMVAVASTAQSTSDVEDLVVGAKIRFAPETERRPALAVRFWTQLPNASDESGLGLDTTNFHFGLLLAKTVQSVRVVGNVGLGILPDPVRGDRQNDVLDYGASVARAVAPGVEIVGEINGRLNTRSRFVPIGTESRSVMRLGGRLTRGPVRIDGALLIGVTSLDPTWGFTTGFTWVFKAFTVR